MDDGATKNGHEQTTDLDINKAQITSKEEFPGDDVRATPDSSREKKDESPSKNDGDRPTNGSVRGGSPSHSHSHSIHSQRGEKQVKPNKVYIGGLPEHTRQEDLQACFGKIGEIVAIELKLGYGFVEFTTRAAAEESVEKYNEGYFMGNKIRVELSHGGGRTAKYAGEPGACFKCGQQGHWARECPSAPLNERALPESQDRGRHYMGTYPVPGNDRPGGKADYPPSRYYLSPRETRIPEGYPPPREYREYRPSRPASPPRGYRDYPAPVRSSREYEDYRMRPPSIPPSRYDSRPPYYPPPIESGYREPPPGYIPRPGYPAPREVPYDRRPPPDRYMYGHPSGARPRSPSGPPPRTTREEYERVTPPRDYPPPPMGEYRGRLSPSRYAEDRPRYRRRSQSPIRSAGTGYAEPPLGYPVSSVPYSGSGGGARSNRDDYRPERNTRA